ncbi:MAG: c-type cytochrome [Actinobacteria bacterium]|nr:c-type cytochrome [Actinomycetota bacterium]
MTARPALLLILMAASVITVMAPASATQDAGVDAGRQIFESNCAMCHGSDASGMMGMHPSLRGAVERLTREGVEVTVRNGRDTNPPMPPFEGHLTDREIEQVIAYIDSLPPGPRNFGPDTDGGGMMDGMMGGWMWILPALVLIVIALAVLAIVRRSNDGRTTNTDDRSPREVLDQRYAAGEIDRDEYLQRRDDLEG